MPYPHMLCVSVKLCRALSPTSCIYLDVHDTGHKDISREQKSCTGLSLTIHPFYIVQITMFLEDF